MTTTAKATTERTGWFDDLQIRGKLLVNAAAVLAPLLLVQGLVLANVLRIQETNEAVTRGEDVQEAASELMLAMTNVSAATRGYLLCGHEDLLVQVTAARTRFDSEHEKLAKLISDPAQLAIIEDIARDERTYLHDVTDAGVAARRGVDAAIAREGDAGWIQVKSLMPYVTEAVALVGGMKQKMATFMAREDEIVDARRHNAEVAARTCYAIGGIGTFVAIVAGFVIATRIARRIVRPIAEAVEVVEGVAAGDFTRQVRVTSQDEVGQMGTALNQAARAMRTALEEVRDVASELSSGSRQLSSAAEQIASGAQVQASSLEETAASLEQITATVQQNSEHCQRANQLADGSRTTAVTGGRVVVGAVGAMGEISQSSRKIAEIIAAIEEIAFQTNILALNAAVEAARAGDHGRGFAVVAAEVRNLAQRSALAAKESKTLIQDSVSKVEAGSSLVNESGKALEGIVESVKQVSGIVGEITAASKEQGQGIAQINKAISQMDRVTQANASQTEELSATAESLAAQADQLNQLVLRFRVGSDDAPRPQAAAPRSRRAAKATVRLSTPADGAFDGHDSDEADAAKNGTNGAHHFQLVASGKRFDANGVNGADGDFQEF